MRRHSSWLAAAWRASRVEMKSSLEQLSAATIALKSGVLRSASSAGVRPCLRRLQHLDAVLVGAGEEEHVPALQAAEARERVRGHGLVGVADMGRIVGIGDGSGDVIGPLVCHGRQE